MSSVPVPPTLEPSRYARHALEAQPSLAAELAAPLPFARKEMDAALDGAPEDDEQALKRRLRRLRQRVLLRVMARDLSGAADLAEVCGAMSDLAEASIAAALAWAEAGQAARSGRPRGAGGALQPLVVVGMGKLGGRELNVSSDVDLVFVYPEEGETDGEQRLSNHEYFARVGRKLIALLADITEDGFAFRVDMRLRPYGESGPLVASFEALENYLVSQGREWERYAWIKARALTGGGARERELESIVRPFVYRKYLDFGTLAAMRRLHADVRHEVQRRELAEHVKLGPGGIREIEFVAQALQLVRAGRDPELAVRPTLDALARLAARRLLPEQAARELAEAYLFLRRVEHRLQYLDDRQTHTLPSDDGDRARVATMCGFATWDAFAAALQAQRERVTRHFQAVFAEAQENGAGELWQDDRAAAARALAARGYRDPEASAARLAAVRASQRYQNLPQDSRRRFDALVPALVAAAAAAGHAPDRTLERCLTLIEAIARRASYLALLAEHPEALERVARIVAASSWAAEFVTRHPLLLDELLDDRVLYAPPDWQAFARTLRGLIAAHEGDPERQMDVLREQHQAQVFRLLAQDLAGLLTVERLADHLSALADLTLEAALELAWRQVRRHREGAPRFAVIAYGKLGGKELGYASDLDMIFLYDDPDERAPETYARLAAKLNVVLTTRTAAGVLFATDLRLRPSGASGLLVSNVAGFEQYQDKQAWVWEHQALSRARFCAGDAAIGAAFEAIRERILRRRRDPKVLAQEVLAMRARMHEGHPNRSGLFDLKHDPGGMIDLEFVVQYLVLAHAHEHARLVGNLGNIALLGMAGELGLIPPGLARRAQDAYREFRRVQHALRLEGASYARVPPEQLAGHAQAVRELWQAVLG